MGVLRTLVTSAVVGATGSARASAGLTALALRRVPSVAALGARAAVWTGTDAQRADAGFRDELLALIDDAAEIASRHARRARLELSERTCPSDPGAGAASRNGALIRRHRVKA